MSKIEYERKRESRQSERDVERKKSCMTEERQRGRRLQTDREGERERVRKTESYKKLKK